MRMKFFSNLLHLGFCSNYWGWFHALAGGLIAKIANIWLSDLASILVVFLLAVIWEVLEYFVECHKSVEHIKRVYGSVEHWAYDCAGDIILAVLFGGIVVI